MIFSEFTSLIAQCPDGIVLIEGRRDIPEHYAAAACKLARGLAIRFTELRFRSGNAKGADQAFSEGVASVDSRRLQVVAPYATHRKKFRYEDAIYDSPDSLSEVKEEEVAFKTAAASPGNEGLIAKRNIGGAVAAKAAYLIRDTMKVMGHSESFPKPICALFYVNLDDPMAGGTGHTVRVCQHEGVPFAFQDSWEKWLPLVS